VVEGVLKKVKKPALDVAKYPTGLDDKVKILKIQSLLPATAERKTSDLGDRGVRWCRKDHVGKRILQ
jgi:hypothetical protein